MDAFERVLDEAPGPDRTAAVAAWFQSLFRSIDEAPILVGGAAVELYTHGAYRTGDLDFVGRVTDDVRTKLEEAGFRRRGRHWVHEESRIFIELPSSRLDASVRVWEIRFGKWKVRALSPEDILVDRLAAWKFWKSVPDGVNAFLLWRDRSDEMEIERLESRASEEHVADALESVRGLADRVSTRSEGFEEVERWARSVQ